jgi:hypothetical protein
MRWGKRWGRYAEIINKSQIVKAYLPCSASVMALCCAICAWAFANMDSLGSLVDVDTRPCLSPNTCLDTQ